MKDFLGQSINPGCYLAGYGGGNVNATYGMILHQVIAVNAEKGTISALRIFVTYPNQQALAEARKVTLKNPNKFVVVEHPPKAALDLFEAIVEEGTSQGDMDKAARWVHGIKPMWGT